MYSFTRKIYIFVDEYPGFSWLKLQFFCSGLLSRLSARKPLPQHSTGGSGCFWICNHSSINQMAKVMMNLCSSTSVLNEVRILQSVSHPCIINLEVFWNWYVASPSLLLYGIIFPVVGCDRHSQLPVYCSGACRGRRALWQGEVWVIFDANWE